jgi:hypothetical protein
MRHRLIATAAAAFVVAASGVAIAQSGAQKKVYCWEEGGRKICSDAFPADAANRARTEISMRSGLRTGQVARALTDEERLAARFAADTARRQAEAEAMRQRRDLAMVESYTTEADLRRAYGARTDLLDETVKASTLGVANLRLSLLSLRRQAGDSELAGEPVPKRLAATIREQHGELLNQQHILVLQREDRAALGAELDDAVARYRAMKQPAADAAPAGADGKPAADAPPPAPAARPAG